MENELSRGIQESGRELKILLQNRNYLHVKAAPADAPGLILWARSRMGMDVLQLISAVDRIEDGEFQITWILERSSGGDVLLISSDYPRKNCRVPTMTSLWPAAAAFERELFEMFGISFPGNPREGEDFLLEGWNEIPPMRRDFDTLKYSMENFGERRAREHTDVRELISRRTGEWETPVPMKEEDR